MINIVKKVNFKKSQYSHFIFNLFNHRSIDRNKKKALNHAINVENLHIINTKSLFLQRCLEKCQYSPSWNYWNKKHRIDFFLKTHFCNIFLHCKRMQFKKRIFRQPATYRTPTNRKFGRQMPHFVADLFEKCSSFN